MTQSERVVIETRGKSKSFGDVQALRNLDLRVPRHSIFSRKKYKYEEVFMKNVKGSNDEC